MNYNFLPIFPIITITVMTGITRYITKTWISPGSFFSLCWSFFLIIPLIFASDYKIDHLALWFITIFTMALASGSIMAYSNNTLESENMTNSIDSTNYLLLYYILVFFSIIIFVGLFLLLNYASKMYSADNYINNWMIIPNMIAIDRYSDVLNYPFLIKYSLYFVYPANLLGGLLLGLRGESKTIKLISMLPLSAAILLGILEGARTSIILGLVLFFSSWLSSFMLKKRLIITKNSLIKFFIIGGCVLASFIIFFILIQWLRQGMDTIVIELFIDRIRAYFFGYLAAFSQWFSGLREVNFYNGFITLAGPFNLIGIMERPLGFYEPVNISNGISTNIFTAYRGLVLDFSIPGSILIAFIIGFLTQIIFQRKKNLDIIDTLPISMFYSFTLYSPLISIFHYNSILFSWLLLLIILIITRYERLDNYC